MDKMMDQIRTYSELIKIPTFDDRFRYLMLRDRVGEETFGVNRWLNQVFYRSEDWRKFRNDIIIRDNGCDLGVPGYEIKYGLLIHHLEPITMQDVINRNIDKLLNPENAITTVKRTHNALHYGDETILAIDILERKPNDMVPWR